MSKNPLWLLKQSGAQVIPSPTGAALPRPSGMFESQAGFSPMPPVLPYPIDVAQAAGGRPEPRLTEYLPGENLPQQPGVGKLVPFAALRALADIVLPIRIALEIRKQEISTQPWDIVIKDEFKDKAEQLEDKRKELKAFFTTPDRPRGLGFSDWIKMAEEDVAVIDALSVYLRPTIGKSAGLFGKGLASMEIIDGSTIKPIRDIRGGRPQPPAVAYQQYLYGAPRSDLIAPDVDEDPDADATVIGKYNASELIYRPFTQRSWSLYGFSDVECALPAVKQWLDREKYWSGYFDKSDMPGLLIPGPAEWKPEQLLAYQQQMFREMAGDPSFRHRLKVVPSAGRGQIAYQIKPPLFDLAFEESAWRRIAMAMRVQPAEMGIEPKGGLGGKGFAEEAGDRQVRLALMPRLTYYAELFNYVIQIRLGIEEFTFQWVDEEQEDILKQAQVDHIYVSDGVRTRNQIAQEHGWPTSDDPEADELMITTAQGVVPLHEDEPPPAPPGQMPPGTPPGTPPHPPVPPELQPKPGTPAEKPETPQDAPQKPEQPEDGEPAAARKLAALAELEQFERFIQKRGLAAARPFVAKVIAPGTHEAVLRDLRYGPPDVPVADWQRFVFRHYRELVKAGGGNASALIAWYNAGADGQIDWGSHGDFEQCVAVASQHIDNPEGFCQERHIDAVGGPAGSEKFTGSADAALAGRIGNAHTGQALSPAALRVEPVERVATLAQPLRGVDGAGADTARNVGAVRDRLKVAGSDAAPVAAEMIEFAPVRDGASQQLVGEDVRLEHPALRRGATKLSVTGRGAASPQPAAVRLQDEAPEAINGGNGGASHSAIIAHQDAVGGPPGSEGRKVAQPSDTGTPFRSRWDSIRTRQGR